MIILLSLAAGGNQKENKPLSQIAPTREELRHTDQDLLKRLTQMEKAFQSLQNQFTGLHGLHDKTSKQRAIAIEQKFKQLESSMAKQKRQKDQLYAQNKALKKENKELVHKLQELEQQLEIVAKKANNPDVARWMQEKAIELANWFSGSSLGYYRKDVVDPITAGVVIYGILLLPMSFVGIYLVKQYKQMTILKYLVALNLFDVGFTLAALISIALLWGDPIQGIYTISETNFIFLQFVLAFTFWSSVAVMLYKAAVSKKGNMRVYLGLELVLRMLVGIDYGRRVWIPAVERLGKEIQVPGVLYVMYFLAAVVECHLSLKANRFDTRIGDGDLLPNLYNRLEEKQGEKSSASNDGGDRSVSAVVEKILGTDHND